MPGIVMVGVDHELLVLARRIGVEVTAVADPHVAGEWHGFPLIGSDAEAIALLAPEGVIIGMDAPPIKRRMHAQYGAAGFTPVDLLGGTIEASSSHLPGLVLQTGALISTDCVIGQCVKIDIGATVMHDVRIGDYATLAPRSLVLGGASIAEGAFIGAQATIMPGIIVGAAAVVGAGALVTNDVARGVTVMGVPAEQV